jgi:predicted ester cyclase
MSHAQHQGCQWFEEVWNRRDPGAIGRLAAADMQAHGADGSLRGQAEFRQFYDTLVAAVPDIRVEVVSCVRGGDYVAVQWRATGTHSGAQDGWPPTGNAIDVPGLTLMRISGPTIAEAWDAFDFGGLMQTMNAPPAPTP